MNWKDESKLKIAYLFLSLGAGCPISDNNCTRFDQLGQNYTGFSDNRRSIISKCNEIINRAIDQNDLYDVISEGIVEQANYSFNTFDSDYDVNTKQCLWLLVNLAFHDGTYTDNEKKIIRSLMRKWNIDKSILLEMEETAETLFDLDKYRYWMETRNEPYSVIKSYVQELDKNQNELSSNISDLINVG
jgi:hypothetical protein